MAAQERRAREYAEARGWEVVAVYFDSRSGKGLRRPGYLRMMAEADGWDVMISWRIDRVHRNAVNFARMMDGLQGSGKAFVAVYEELDSTTVYGAFAMDIIARLAQLESEQIGERVLLGMRQRVRRGGYVARTPHGYRRGRDGALELSPEASEVRYAFILRSRGEPYARIAYLLNLEADPPAWTVGRVRRMISNPVYAGFVRWGGLVVKGNHSPIVPLDLWESVNGNICLSG